MRILALRHGLRKLGSPQILVFGDRFATSPTLQRVRAVRANVAHDWRLQAAALDAWRRTVQR